MAGSFAEKIYGNLANGWNIDGFMANFESDATFVQSDSGLIIRGREEIRHELATWRNNLENAQIEELRTFNGCVEYILKGVCVRHGSLTLPGLLQDGKEVRIRMRALVRTRRVSEDDILIYQVDNWMAVLPEC